MKDSFKQYKLSNGASCYYEDRHNGGGVRWATDFVSFFEKFHPNGCNSILEWCCGPAFIGFDLLAAGFCKRLTLVDINPDIKSGVERTIDELGELGNKVSLVIRSDLQTLDLKEKFDVIVGNPPHVDVLDPATPALPFSDDPPILYSDPGWQIHRRFFSCLPIILKRSGEFVLIENGYYTSLETFKDMPEASEVLLTHEDSSHEKFWFLRGKFA